MCGVSVCLCVSVCGRACVCVRATGLLQADLPGDVVPIWARRHGNTYSRKIDGSKEVCDRSSALHEQVGSQ